MREDLRETSDTITRHPTLKTGYFSQKSGEEPLALSENGAAPKTALTHFISHFAKVEAAAEKSNLRSFSERLGLLRRLTLHTSVKR